MGLDIPWIETIGKVLTNPVGNGIISLSRGRRICAGMSDETTLSEWLCVVVCDGVSNQKG